MMSPDKTVYLIDSSIYVYRAWRLLPDSITDNNGHPTNAVYGFAEFLVQVLQQTDAEYLVCAFDESSGMSARKKIYSNYKSNRSTTPPALRHQFGLCQTLCKHLGLPAFSSGGYEADDIIGTLADAVRLKDMNVSIVSADKDLTQFIRTDDEFWDYARQLKTDAKGIQKRFGIRPQQIPDMLALCGDKVDNIPGVPGVGAATAARLLIKWGTLDTLFEHTDSVSTMKFRGAAHVAELLQQHEPTVRLSRQLTGLLQVDGLPTSPSQLSRRPIDSAALQQFLLELGFDDDKRQHLLTTLDTVQ